MFLPRVCARPRLTPPRGPQYHTKKEVMNLKEVEKHGSEAGVNQNSIKDVNQQLVDDNIVSMEKIGGGNSLSRVWPRLV